MLVLYMRTQENFIRHKSLNGELCAFSVDLFQTVVKGLCQMPAKCKKSFASRSLGSNEQKQIGKHLATAMFR